MFNLGLYSYNQGLSVGEPGSGAGAGKRNL